MCEKVCYEDMLEVYFVSQKILLNLQLYQNLFPILFQKNTTYNLVQYQKLRYNLSAFKTSLFAKKYKLVLTYFAVNPEKS